MKTRLLHSLRLTGRQRSTFQIALLLVATMLTGCSILSKPAEPVPPPPVEKTVIEADPETIVAEPIITPPAPVVAPEKSKPLKVAIIVSLDIENHHRLNAEISQLITQKGGTAEAFYLYQQSHAEIAWHIRETQHRQVVAIGLEAAKTTRLLSDVPVVFCQIYNYQEHNLVSDYRKGVSLIPSIEQQLNAWQAIFPSLQRVGVIASPGKQPLIKHASAAADSHNITLISRTASNDKELWHEFRRLIPQVDAFWLLPDNRILSKRTLRNIASYSTKHSTPLFTINGLLLQAGAVISALQVESDIAQQVVSRFATRSPENLISGPAVLPLTMSRILLNTQAISQFNPIINNEIAGSNIEKWPSMQVEATISSQ